MIDEGEYRDCRHCGGSGDDPADWSGKCIFCGGIGEVWASFRNWDGEEGEEDEARAALAARGNN